MSVLDEYLVDDPTQTTTIAGMGNAPSREAFMGPSRAAFFYYFSKLPAKTQSDLKSGKRQTQDVGYYYTREVEEGESDIEIFQSDDRITKGRSNLSEARTPSDKPCVISFLYLEYGTIGANDDDNVFRPADIPDELLNGDMKLQIDEKLTLNKGLHEFRFPTNHYNNQLSSMVVYKMDNPKYVPGGTLLEFELDLRDGMPAPPPDRKHAVRVTLKGVGVNTA